MYFLCTRDGAIIWHNPSHYEVRMMLNIFYFDWNLHIEYYDYDMHYCEVQR